MQHLLMIGQSTLYAIQRLIQREEQRGARIARQIEIRLHQRSELYDRLFQLNTAFERLLMAHAAP